MDIRAFPNKVVKLVGKLTERPPVVSRQESWRKREDAYLERIRRKRSR